MKRHILKALALLLVAVAVFSMAACGKDPKPADTTTSEAAKVTVNVATLKGPTGMGMVKLMKTAEQKAAANNYNFALESDPTVIGPKLFKGEVDIAACPLNMSAALYNKAKKTEDTKDDLVLLAINTLGVLYVLENGDSVKSVADLKGKTLYATGLGATPEYALNYVLNKNNINPKEDLTIEFKSEHSELATLAVKGDAKLLLLPEPFVTTVLSKNKDLRIALDLTQEWDKTGNGATFAMGAIVARADFVKNNPEAVSAFLAEYKQSVDYVNQNQSDAAALIVNFEIVADVELATKAIPGSKLTFIAGKEMKETALANFQVLFDADKTSVGGALPGDDFYYNS